MKFESKYDLGEVLATNYGGILVKVIAIAFDNDGVAYVCRRPDGCQIAFKEDEVNNDDSYGEENEKTTTD